MFLFIATDIIFLAFGTVLYLMVRALPRVSEEPSERQGILDRFAHSQVPEKIDAVIDAFLLKSLRKIKIFTMRLDNMLSKHLRKINIEDESKVMVDFSGFVSGHAAEERELQEVA